MGIKKKIMWSVVLVFLGILLVISFVPGNIDAATCTHGQFTCTGECCMAGPTGCKAGPCKDLFPHEY